MQLVAIWKANFQTLGSAWHNDAKIRIGWVIAGLVNLGAIWWGSASLSENIAKWRTANELGSNMWLVLLGSLAAIIFFSGLELFQTITEDRNVVLMTLPLAPVIRFRALYSQVGLSCANWIVTLSLIVGLGSGFSGWFLAASALLPLGILLGVVGSLLVLRFILPNLKKVLVAWVCLVGLSGLLNLVAQLQGWELNQLNLSWPEPGWVALSSLAIVGLALWPVAKIGGQLYQAAFWQMQGRTGRHSTDLPGFRWIGSLIQRRRSLAGAMLAKGWYNRGRNPLFWARGGTFLVALLIFPWLREALSGLQMEKWALVAAYALLISTLNFVDSVPSAIGSEANRLTFYLLAPLKPTKFMQARLLTFLLPTLLICEIFSLALSLLAGLEGTQIILVELLIASGLSGIAGALTWLSAWDADINQVVEGAVQTFMVEEAPITLRRIWLLNLGLLLAGLQAGLLYWLPGWGVLVASGLVSGIVLKVSWGWGLRGLARLVK